MKRPLGHVAWTITAFAVCLALSACAAAPRVDRTLLPERNLERLAASEARSARPRATPVPIPPGAPPELLAPRAAGDAAAGVGLYDALAAVAARHPAVAAPAAPPVSHEAAAEALRRYVKGRDAAAAARHLVAITELDKAHELDPSSAPILRQLARSYLAMANGLKAASLYEQLLSIEPNDSEALFTMGMAAAGRRDFAKAAAYLSRPRLSGRSFEQDPAADLLASYRLADALVHLGYDRAAIELLVDLIARLEAGLALPTGYAQGLRELYTRRGDLWQTDGDAHCRLREYVPALAAYARCAPLTADRDGLRMRVVYADLCLGRVHAAQLEVLIGLGAGGAVGDGDIRLCGYLAEQSDQLDLLADAVVERSREHPDQPGLARAAAVLLDQRRAVALLREVLERRPDDLDVYAQLVSWLIGRDSRATAELTVGLSAAHPRLAGAYVDRLAAAAPVTTAMISAVASLPPSPARSFVLSRLHEHLGALGPAWDAIIEARRTWPDSAMVILQQAHVAAGLMETQLVEAAVAAAPLDDPGARIACAAALGAVGLDERAIEAAEAAHRLAPDDAAALVAVAEAFASHATRLSDPADRQAALGRAVAAADEAVQIDPGAESAWALLIVLGGMNAELGASAADGTSLRQRLDGIRDRLARAEPDSRLGRRYDAQSDMRDHRFEAAIEKLRNLYESDPTDLESLALVMSAWTQLGQLDSAQEWLEERLRQRPGDPALLTEWVAVQVRRNRFAAAVERLEGVLAAEPGHDIARANLESLYRRLGQVPAAVRMAEVRLGSRPPGIHRDIQLAALYGTSDRPADALLRLRKVLAASDEASYEQLVAGLTVAGRLSDSETAHRHEGDELVLAFTERAVERYPEQAPLQIYGSGMRALARLGELDDRFDRLARLAVRHSQGATGPALAAADLWRQLAQALVEVEQPAAAARALRVRLLADMPLDADSFTLLCTVTLVADAAANRPQDTIALLEMLAERRPLPDVLGAARPTLADALYEASSVYTLLGHVDGAVALLRRTLEHDAGNVMAKNNLGYTLLEKGAADDRIAELIEEAFAQQPHDANILDTMGWLHYMRGQLGGDEAAPGALRLVESALEQADEPSPEVLDHLGDIRWRLGDAGGAVKAWRRVVEVVEDPDRRQKLLQLYGLIQSRRWWLVVADPDDLLERSDGPVLERDRRKVERVDAGSEPAVAQTFAERNRGQGRDDGRP